jgi:hypothetical protein
MDFLPPTGINRAAEIMNVDNILEALSVEKVDFILIGGMNFLIRHIPELTFDVDIWVQDTDENLARLNRALKALGAAWGPTERDWKWLRGQSLFCLTTREGAVDVFRDVLGLEGSYAACRGRAAACATAAGQPFLGLSDEDMLACQEALPESERKPSRMEHLRRAIRERKGG